MNIVLFETAGKQKYNAGSKARQDALKIAISCGYKHIPLFHNGNTRFLIVLEIIRSCFSSICHIGKEEQLVVQYPYYPMLMNKFLFWVLRTGKNIKEYNVSVLIHDLPGLRDYIFNDSSQNVALSAELHMMRGCNLIYHNEAMRDICESVCPASSYQILESFDYLYSGETCQRKYSVSPTVMIAGNLSREKSGYVYQLYNVKGIDFDVFGANYEGGDAGNIHYRGKFAPEELISRLDGQFGLVWDGDTINSCNGTTGNYLRYNNPHKFSLYIAAGVPVIVWKKSAMAEYVSKNRIGISVHNLCELSSRLSKIDETRYNQMVENVMRVREDIIHGRQLLRVLSKVN